MLVRGPCTAKSQEAKPHSLPLLSFAALFDTPPFPPLSSQALMYYPLSGGRRGGAGEGGKYGEEGESVETRAHPLPLTQQHITTLRTHAQLGRGRRITLMMHPSRRRLAPCLLGECHNFMQITDAVCCDAAPQSRRPARICAHT